jgi:hypothetical protein
MDYFFFNTDARAFRQEPRPRFPVLIAGGFAAAGGDRKKYGEQFGQLKLDDILLMYENGVGVVAIGRVREQWDGVSHTTPRYYKSAELSGLDGGPHEYRIAVEWFLDLGKAPIGIEHMRERFSYKPEATTVTRGTIDRISKQRDKVAGLIEEAQTAGGLLPGEVARSAAYTEGATRLVSVNACERNREAVRQCKQHHGTVCSICRFDFGAVYGAEFAGFIHVHHLRPLSEIGKEYKVDPEADLCPVCPNCHAVIHHGGRLRTIDEVRQLLDQ